VQSKANSKLIVEAVTGHNNLRFMAAKCGASDSNECRLCMENEETFLHFLTDCPALEAYRMNNGIGKINSSGN
jgi:hypothetical protein